MADEKTLSNGDSTQAVQATKGEKKSEGSDNGRTETGLSLARPIQDTKGEIQVGSYAIAGLRPVASSTLQVYGTIANNRPVLASPLRVVSYAGNRPIFASEIVVLNEVAGRPVSASNPALLQASGLPGGRPIASNEIDDPEGLLGYLD